VVWSQCPRDIPPPLWRRVEPPFTHLPPQQNQSPPVSPKLGSTTTGCCRHCHRWIQKSMQRRPGLQSPVERHQASQSSPLEHLRAVRHRSHQCSLPIGPVRGRLLPDTDTLEAELFMLADGDLAIVGHRARGRFAYLHTYATAAY